MNPVEKYGKKKVIIALAVGLVALGLLLYFGNDYHMPYNN